MEIKLNSADPFSLEFTLCCGQAFRWERHGEWWYGVVRNTVLKARQEVGRFEIQNVKAAFGMNYFGLNDNLPQIFSMITKDEHIQNAINRFAGLRILRQDPWECLVSYICATYKNIPAIRQMLLNLTRGFGDKIHLDGKTFYTFPLPEILAKASQKELTRCGLGFRARYVSETAKIIHKNSLDLESLRNMAYEEAKKELIALPGVGLKVADCVLLFSLGKLDAFPVDVWIKRAMVRHYSDRLPRSFLKKVSEREGLSDSDYRRLNEFGRRYFGKYAGYAQEYLYHFERTLRWTTAENV